LPATRAIDDLVPGDPIRRAATLHDAARRAGVHPSTASRALSGPQAVRPELARAVRHAARELDYQVNHIGRALHRSGLRAVPGSGTADARPAGSPSPPG
jgi:hypothetical protein